MQIIMILLKASYPEGSGNVVGTQANKKWSINDCNVADNKVAKRRSRAFCKSVLELGGPKRGQAVSLQQNETWAYATRLIISQAREKTTQTSLTLRKIFYGASAMASKLSLCLWYQHAKWALVRVLMVLFHIWFCINSLGKWRSMAQVLTSMSETRKRCLDPAFGPAQLWLL